MRYRKCKICGTEYEGNLFEDGCPLCGWIESYYDDDNEYDTINHMTAAEAKENFAKGLDMWGDPLANKDN